MRDYQFNVGPETAALPSATDPTVAADLVTKGFADLNYLGLYKVETQFTLANNQSSATSITGLVFDQSLYRSAIVNYTIERRTSTQGYRQTGRLVCQYEAFSGTWTIDDLADAGSSGASTGVTFSIDPSTGQLKYATDNMSGSTYVGKLRYKIFCLFLKET